MTPMKHFPASFTSQMNWIAANRDTSWKIRYTIHVGDIVHNGTDTARWTPARDGFAKLDGEVPYATAPGNHDYNDADRRIVTAAQMAAYPEGPAWPRYPHAVRGEGTSAVYFLDTPFP